MRAWQSISPAVTLKGFMQSLMASAVDGTDNMLCDGSDEVGNVRSEC